MRHYCSCLHHKTGKTTSYKCAAQLGGNPLQIEQVLSTKLSVTKQLFSSFIESYLFYCLVIIYNHLYSTEKKMLNDLYDAVKHPGIEKMNLMETLKKRTKKYIMNAYHHDYILTSSFFRSSSIIQTQMVNEYKVEIHNRCMMQDWHLMGSPEYVMHVEAKIQKTPLQQYMSNSTLLNE